MNNFCYFIIFAVHCWDNIYFINIKKGKNNQTSYFMMNAKDFCIIHKIYDCKCGSYMSNDDVISQYIKYYNYLNVLNNKNTDLNNIVTY